MITSRDLKHAPGIGIEALFDVLHPGSIYPDGNLIFGFACDGAGVASDALAIIDYEAVFHR
jgi:hypothetical protein